MLPTFFNKRAKIFIKILTPFFIIFLSINPLFPSKIDKINVNTFQNIHNDDDTAYYYWFFVRVDIEKKSGAYKILGTSNSIEYGYLIDFEKELWQGLSKRMIAVGPFYTSVEAVNARRLYKSKKEKIKDLPEGEVPENVYWFAINFYISSRLKIFVLQRTKARVEEGNEIRFIDAFYEQIPYQQLPIGPFYDKIQAEFAKRLYRMNE